MKILRILVDKKPEWCMSCPLFAKTGGECGTYKTVKLPDGWETGGRAPDGRCIMKEIESREEWE